MFAVNNRLISNEDCEEMDDSIRYDGYFALNFGWVFLWIFTCLIQNMSRVDKKTKKYIKPKPITTYDISRMRYDSTWRSDSSKKKNTLCFLNITNEQ